MTNNTASSPNLAYRGYVLSILILIYTFNFIDRQIIGILAIPIQEDLGISDTMLGLMRGFSFALFYSILGIPIALFADRYNRVRIVAFSLTIWSAMTAICGLATNFIQMFLARMAVGIGEAGGVAPSYSIISDYFPPEKRSRAIAIYSFGIPIGSAIGIVFGGVVATILDWRTALILVGLAGIFIVPLFLFTVREPVRGQFDQVHSTPQTKHASIGEVLAVLKKKPSFWLLSVGGGCSAILSYGVFAWLPAFLVRSHGDALVDYMSFLPGWMFPEGSGPLLSAAYFYGVIVLIGGVVGLFLGGWLSDTFGQKNKKAYALIPAAAFALTIPFYIFSALTPSLTLVFFVMLVPTSLGIAWIGPTVSTFQQITPLTMRTTSTAVFLLINSLIGLGLGDVIIGGMSDALKSVYGQESLRYSILYGTVFYVISTILFFISSFFIEADWETPTSTPMSQPRFVFKDIHTSDSKFETHYFKNSNGLKLEYRDYPGSDPNLPYPVLCLHGLTRNLRDFSEFAPRIQSLGYRVITVSQRGRGLSDFDPDTTQYTPQHYTNDTMSLLDNLEISKAIFVGSSMGGIMTMLAARKNVDRIHAAILNDIGIDLSPQGIARIMSYVGSNSEFENWGDAEEACMSINSDAFPKEKSSSFWTTFTRKICAHNNEGKIEFAYDTSIANPTRSQHAAIPRYHEEFNALNATPTLLVRGQLSDLLTHETASKMQKLNPNLKYVEISDVGHVPFLTEPDAWSEIATFLQSLNKNTKL